MSVIKELHYECVIKGLHYECVIMGLNYEYYKGTAL